MVGECQLKASSLLIAKFIKGSDTYFYEYLLRLLVLSSEGYRTICDVLS